MKVDLDFAKDVVDYNYSHYSTIPKTAAYFGISKSTVHRYLTKVFLNSLSRDMIEKNKYERYYRGGQAAKTKKQFSKKPSF